MTTSCRLISFAACGVWALVGVLVGAQATQPPTAARCRVDGRVTSGGTPLPGVAIVVQVGDAIRGTTSTDLDGRYTIAFTAAFPAGATYHISADLTAFTAAGRDVTLDAPPCDTTADFVLALRPRRPLTTAGRDAAGRGAPPPQTEPPAPGQEAAGDSPNPPAQGGRGRGARAAQAGQRFQTLTVETDATGAAALDTAPPEEAADVARLLPPGFSVESTQADSIAVTGDADAARLDRGVLSERLQAIRLG